MSQSGKGELSLFSFAFLCSAKAYCGHIFENSDREGGGVYIQLLKTHGESGDFRGEGVNWIVAGNSHLPRREDQNKKQNRPPLDYIAFRIYIYIVKLFSVVCVIGGLEYGDMLCTVPYIRIR